MILGWDALTMKQASIRPVIIDLANHNACGDFLDFQGSDTYGFRDSQLKIRGPKNQLWNWKHLCTHTAYHNRIARCLKCMTNAVNHNNRIHRVTECSGLREIMSIIIVNTMDPIGLMGGFGMIFVALNKVHRGGGGRLTWKPTIQLTSPRG